MLTLSTPYPKKDRNIEDDEPTQLRWTIEKESEEEKNCLSKQMCVLVPKTNVWEKKRALP